MKKKREIANFLNYQKLSKTGWPPLIFCPAPPQPFPACSNCLIIMYTTSRRCVSTQAQEPTSSTSMHQVDTKKRDLASCNVAWDTDKFDHWMCSYSTYLSIRVTLLGAGDWTTIL
jgi:hypothetical protein